MSRPIFIAGGGTGGHIYPAVSVARAIQKINPQQKVIFIGSTRGLESKIIPREGYELITLPAGQLNRSAGRQAQVMTMFILPFALLKSLWLCVKYRPKAVFGVGGYASGPVMLVASLLGFKTAIWEPNAMPGMANRLLSRFVRTCYVVFDKARGLLQSKNIKASGVPIRFSQTNDCRARETKNVLVFGGSQGARGINLVVRELLKSANPVLQDVCWVHQIGRNDFAEYDADYQANLSSHAKKNIQWLEFLHDMEARYEWADLVICRSGASTVAELAACGKPAILIPFPQAADNHQQHNAEQLVAAGAAEMILQKDLTPEKLAEKVVGLLSDPPRRENMCRSVKQFHRDNSALQIAQDLLNSSI